MMKREPGRLALTRRVRPACWLWSSPGFSEAEWPIVLAVVGGVVAIPRRPSPFALRATEDRSGYGGQARPSERAAVLPASSPTFSEGEWPIVLAVDGGGVVAIPRRPSPFALKARLDGDGSRVARRAGRAFPPTLWGAEQASFRPFFDRARRSGPGSRSAWHRPYR
jgi:hypothetical protein